MAVTLGDIAKKVGVKPPTVSLVLNNKQGAIKISDKTREKIQRVARELGYQPNTAARALRTRRSGQVGLLLSDTVLGGWDNAYYVQFLTGVERACHETGYGLMVSRYNLTNVDKFVFPAKVRGRSVDGLILSGPVQAAVIKRFKEFGVPCVAIGANTEQPGLLPTISTDMVADLMEGIRYLYHLGHRRIGLCNGRSRDGQRIARMLNEQVNEDPALAGCQLIQFEQPVDPVCPMEGQAVFDQWWAMPERDRPTAFMAGNQMVVGFLKALQRQGLRCPEDLSLISVGETSLNRLVNPELTTLSDDLIGAGHLAVRMLVDFLDQGTEMVSVSKGVSSKNRLIVRESCAPPKTTTTS